VTTTFERRLAALEAAIAPEPPSACARFVEQNPWFEWLSFDELLELDEIYRHADDDGDQMPPADQARAMSIMYEAEGRRLSGAPKDIDLPPQPYDIDAAYRKSEAAYRAKLARERNGDD
jgi:hypothetical protein